MNIEPQEIRIWESEFPQIKSLKTAKGQRIFRREDVILFASIKHLLKEKKLTVAGAQRVLAEADENYLMHDDDDQPFFAAKEVQTSVEPEAMLEDAARMLFAPEDDYDERSQKLYQHCTSIEQPAEPVLEKEHFSEMIQDAFAQNAHQEAREQGISRIEYDRLHRTLTDSKDSLQQVLRLLNRYDQTSWLKDVRTGENH